MRGDKDILRVKKKRGLGLAMIKYCIEVSILGLESYIKKNKERLIMQPVTAIKK